MPNHYSKSLFRLLAIAMLSLGTKACASGDSLFSDASAAHSGRYERDLAAKRSQLAAEQARGTAAAEEQQALQTRTRELDRQIAQQKQSLRSLEGDVAALDAQTREARAATEEAEEQKVRLRAQIESLEHEVASLQRRAAADPSAAELQALKAREKELRQTYSDLLAIYKTM